MIKHIVVWKLKDTITGKNRTDTMQEIKKRLETLPNDIPEIRKLEAGINFNTAAQAYDIVLYSEFDDEKALDIYQKHPAHTRFKDFIESLRKDRIVVDYRV
ncbi:MAG: Dabb family protein [Chitinivibrionales bacterium]|nr:Dabb family protein [Chitinivibrionales bacterium]